MAASSGMSNRAQLDAELDRLAEMLPPWLGTLRREVLFWPQFNALAQQILDHSGEHDEPHVRQRLDAMLAANRMVRPGERVFTFIER